MKKTILTIVVLCSIQVIALNAQNSIRVDTQGTFLVQDGVIKVIQTKYDICTTLFWGDYLFLFGEGSSGYYIYNLKTEYVSEWIWHDNIMKIEKGDTLNIFVIISEFVSRKLKYELWEYTFDPNTLKLKNEKDIGEKTLEDIWDLEELDVFDFLYFTEKEKIGERSYRHSGNNYYLDITYGSAIDLTGKYLPYTVYGGTNNIFLVNVYEILPYK